MKLKFNFYHLGFLFLVPMVLGCDYFEKTEEQKAVVRVNDTYLYEDDIRGLLNANTSAQDSALIVSNYITRWATQQLLIDRAKLNLSQEKQREFRDLVENYRNELYTNAYTEAVVSRELDSTLSEEEIKAYYEEHKENFKLNEDLVKLRYVKLDENNTNIDQIKKRLVRFEEKDKDELERKALQFKNYSLNDSVWVRTKSVYEKIKPLAIEDRSRLLNKSNFMQLEDSLGVYLVYVKDVLIRNEQAPLEYASATIKQILLNKRKLNLVKELEKDITKDAIKNNQFEIYD
ncbi:peptidyl-prolyl cis-trans isomerase [Salegentibacter chungangensis]|uniref:Peptidyl-prolyl cis-trans isomerase n=1 Tax=Salegentibacter chungangensis TaxID=1335724 RepID=A0ABW3NUB4_9FLAO